VGERKNETGLVFMREAMIKDRPKRLTDLSKNILVPPEPFSVSWEMIPEVVRLSLMPVCGVQPVTTSMFRAADQDLSTAPTEGEISYFRERGTRFQMIQIVLSLAWWETRQGGINAIPFAISAIPVSKRGEVTHTSIDGVSSLCGAPVSTEDVYTGFDPFSGEWAMYVHAGNGALIGSEKQHLDELGIVIERFFLATEFEHDDVVEFDAFITDDQSKKAYRKNRIKKLFQPFSKVRARRLWGLETPIELFLFQELLSRGERPECQYLIYPDGSAFQSLYDMYSDIEFRRGQNLLAEADLFMPKERLAIFCDGAHHERRKQKDKDARINSELEKLGIRSVRLPGRLINSDLKAAGDLVEDALNDIRKK
jgi:very-short-patch-repair endonuclease